MTFRQVLMTALLFLSGLALVLAFWAWQNPAMALLLGSWGLCI